MTGPLPQRAHPVAGAEMAPEPVGVTGCGLRLRVALRNGRSRRAWPTTETLENAIAAPASIGLSNAEAALKTQIVRNFPSTISSRTSTSVAMLYSFNFLYSVRSPISSMSAAFRRFPRVSFNAASMAGLSTPRKHIYTLDPKGHRVEYRIVQLNGAAGDEKYVYKYDSNGNRVAEELYHKTSLISRNENTYDPRLQRRRGKSRLNKR